MPLFSLYYKDSSSRYHRKIGKLKFSRFFILNLNRILFGLRLGAFLLISRHFIEMIKIVENLECIFKVLKIKINPIVAPVKIFKKMKFHMKITKYLIMILKLITSNIFFTYNLHTKGYLYTKILHYDLKIDIVIFFLISFLCH